MKRSADFSCPDCSMVFRSLGLLDKHKSRFCIGNAIGDLEVLKRGRVEIGEPKKVDLKAFRPRVTKTPTLIHGLYPGRKRSDGETHREVCEHHEQKLAEIQKHTSQLEQQRKEIERQMALVGHDGMSHLEEMLHRIKEQEERNEEVLYRLSTQISALQGSLHLAYIQSGGSDPEVLAQLNDLQAEANTVEQSRPAAEHQTRKTRRRKSSPAALDLSIKAVRYENQQLEEQIVKLQIDRERHRGRAGGLELSRIQRHHIHQLSILQTEISNLKKELEKSRERKTNPPAREYSSQHHLLMDRHVFDLRNSLGPAPYDPESGFVILYDMVVGVDAMVRTLHLIAWLFSEEQEIGPPIPMPPVHCQPAGALGYPARRRAENYALLAFQQPLHRMQPSPSLFLVVEVQVVGSFGLWDQEVQGWSKLQLFDNHNQVQSGFWKLPFRSPPVRPTLSSTQLNAVPQLGNMEICLRVLNARDGDVQSLATIDPNNSKEYKYPLVEYNPSMVISHSNTDTERQASQPKPSHHQVLSNPFLSLSPQTDHIDPPPKDGDQR
ncbi:Coiled-coil domain-containing protein 17 [Bagarius yarrelli]|uniref:Coiled-coil domain-containing protein 17 n=1 Tax=Bagarius yarrelli TaxID=175774 RepID=A0A556TY28_BAGYA|nr:Coiled-coil domain-containing protein 17 [Bagarius yarrelli]